MGGGSQTTETKIPEWLSGAAQQALARANSVAAIPYAPYFGPDVAAMTPMQEAAMSNINAGASAFGMAAPTGSGMPEAQTFAGGVRGYSSAPMYDAAVNELKTRFPGQYNAIMGQFINPVTGALPSWLMPAAVAPASGPIVQQGSGGGSPMPYSSSTGNGGNWSSSALAARLPGGVNDPNLTRPINQMVAKVTQTKPSAPTQVDRPVSRSTASTSKSFKGGR